MELESFNSQKYWEK